MKVFELHFNPRQAKTEPDLIFDSFCYEPGNVYEKRLGSLFVVGELKNALPQNLRFLDNLANFLKKQYYSAPVRFSPEVALKEGLKKTNEFLEKIMKSGDVSWLGNLNSVILALIPRQKKWWEVNFTKIGDIKILLLRNGEIIDIGKNLEFQEIEPYPLKIFGNIVSGKLIEGDIILIATKDIFSVFADPPQKFGGIHKKPKRGESFPRSLNLIEQIAVIAPFEEEKKLKEILKTKEKELLKTSGICLLCFLTKEEWVADKKPKIFTYQREAERFSILQAFQPVVDTFKGLKLRFLKNLAKLKEVPRKLFKLKKPKIKAKIKKPKIKIPLRHFRIELTDNLRKNLISLLLLIILLISGFFIFKREEQIKLKEYKLILTTVNQDISQADNFLLLKNQEKAFSILKKAWQELLPLAERKSAIQKEAISLKNSLEEKLEKISKLEKIPDPKLFFEFDQKEFVPQKMVFFNGDLYFYNSFADNVYKLSPVAEKIVLQTDKKFNKAESMDNALLFFQKPNLIFFLKDNNFEGPIPLKLPYPDFSPNNLATFMSNLYFLDEKKGEILKYPAPLEQGKDSPQLWLNPTTKKVIDAKSMTIDGSLWILNNDNTISRYFGGELKETINLNLFPFPKNFKKIVAIGGYLYILEPDEKRIILIDQNGKLIKQIFSQKFNNLLDFAVSENGKTIWLLNNNTIYQISY
jgi:hypothetical protein